MADTITPTEDTGCDILGRGELCWTAIVWLTGQTPRDSLVVEREAKMEATDQILKEMQRELTAAGNAALDESPRVAAVLELFRGMGYDAGLSAIPWIHYVGPRKLRLCGNGGAHGDPGKTLTGNSCKV